MSDKGEVFVTIDTSQLEALRSQLQGTGGGGGGGVEGDTNPPIGDISQPDGYYLSPSMDPSQWGGESDWSARVSGYFLDPNIVPDGGGGGFGGAAGGGLIYAIPRPLRTVIGASIPGG